MTIGRIRERDLIIPALQAAAIKPSGFITTSDLIAELTATFDPQGEDGELLHGRVDTKFSQKVRNLVSHRDGRHSIFNKGYATYDSVAEGIHITDLGRRFLDQVPE